MTVTPDQVIQTANKYLGYQYGYWDRCGGSHHQLDCSGLCCRVMGDLGLWIGCLTSFVMADLCWRNGLIIPYADAEHRKAHWAIRGPNGGRGPSMRANGSDGHIVIGAGDGTTREAMGHAYGVRIGSWYGRGWSAYSKIPGVTYTPVPPPPPPAPKIYLENTMIIQKFHLAPDGHTRVPVPAKDAQGHYHIQRIFVRADGTGLDEIGGASLNNDKPFTGSHRVWFPPTNDPLRPFNPKVDKVIAVEDWDPKDGTVPGVFVQFSNGYGRPERFS